ncbi:MAG: aldehyde dehydrogenase family protein, partial [Planctomycetota bacterium]
PTASLIPDFADRVRAVKRFRALLAAHADELVALVGEEIHKPEFEALASEVLPLLSSCTWHIRHAKRVLRDRTPPGKPLWLLAMSHRVARRPLGRVAIIATWNYPVQLVGVQIVQAFMGGNEIIVKPSERSPKTQALLLDMAERAGIGLARVPATREAGEQLVREESFDHLLFTGSTGVGKAIAKVLAERLIPSTLELSGNDSAVVLPSADPVLAARCIWYGLTLNHGQTCMAPHRAFVAPQHMTRFLDEIRTLAETAEPRKLIDDAATEHCRAVAREAIDAGGELVCGDPDADVVSPMVVAKCPHESRLYRGEHFGPLLAVTMLADEPEARTRDTDPDPLTLSVFGSKADARAFASRSRAGTIAINDCIIPTGHPGAPLSAVGDSGWGVSRGVEGLLAMTRPVSVSTTPGRIRLPLDPPSTPVSKITPWLRRLYARGGPARKSATRTEDTSG